MLAISLIIAGIVMRCIPHAPNFTPIAAIALFGGACLNRKSALIVPLALMMISDLFLGTHTVMAFTWGGFLLITILGFLLQQKRTGLRIVSLSLASSLLFFTISNFGVWAMGWYPPTLQGFIQCYVMALPFLRDFVISTLLYTAILFASYELIALRFKDRKLARVLLKKI